jgi:hypothetical protein
MASTNATLHRWSDAEAAMSVQALVPSFNTLAIHKLQFPDRNQLLKEAESWSQRLFRDGRHDDCRAEPVVHDNRIVLRHPDGYRVRAYFASGSIEYKNTARGYRGMTPVEIRQDAEEIVKQFAETHDLWPLDSLGLIRPNRFELTRGKGVSRGAAASTEITHNAILSFRRYTMEVPWIGPGALISAMIEGKEVIAFERNWRSVIPTPGHAVPVLPLGEALESLLVQMGRRGLRELGALDLVGAEFGYFADSKWALQRFLQPAYLITLRVRGQVGVRLTFVLAAHREKVESLEAPPLNGPRGQRS